jgi:1-acyl-sn-glycerol-3-phosphate acyltransferase
MSVSRSKTAKTNGAFGPVVVLMNLWCYGLLVLWTVVAIAISPLALVFSRLVLRWPVCRIIRWFIWLYGRVWLAFMSPFVRFRREQMGLLKSDTPYLFVVNHRSFFDTYCMALLPVHDITYAVRSWPFKMPWYGGFMRLAKYLDVEGNSWDETLRKSKIPLGEKGAVLFFPEGHRSRDGELQRFYSGGFKVAISAGVQLVPLCIDGTDQLLPPGRSWFHPCRVTLRALEPIDTSQYDAVDGHIRLRKLIKKRMATALSEMRGESA